MSKIKGIAAFIIFLVLIVLAGLFVKLPIPAYEKQSDYVSGLIIQFRDGTTEPEAKAVLENYSLPTYKLDYNIDFLPDKHYYIIVDKNKIMDIRDELKKGAYLTDPASPDIEKGSYYVVTITDKAIQNKNFLTIMEKNNFHVNKFVWCHVHLGERPMSGISKERADELKRELEANEKVFLVEFETIFS
jgi:Uncharacterised protein family (UPF0228)